MRLTLLSSASAVFAPLLIATVLANDQARGVDLEDRQLRSCVNDDYLGLFNEYLPAQADITSFCSTLIGITDVTSTVATTTPRVTIYPSTVTVETITEASISYSATATATVTATAYVAKKKRAEVAARAAITAKAAVLEPVLFKARDVVAKRQVNVTALELSLSSACTCKSIKPATQYFTATVATQTRTQNIVYYDTATVYSPVSGGVTTTTVTLNSTSSIIPRSTKETTVDTATVMSTSSGSITFDTSSAATTSTTSTTSTASPTSVVVPSGCPDVNGTYYPSPDNCTSYQAFCGRSFKNSDFYSLKFNYGSYLDCRFACDSANAGVESPCLGIVYEANIRPGMPNCNIVLSKSDPIEDPSAIALLLVPSIAPQCRANSTNSTNSTTASSTSSQKSMFTSWSVNATTTSQYRPTGTGHSSHNHSHSHRPTGYSTGTVPIGGATSTANSTCPITTVTKTMYYSTSFYETITVTANTTTEDAMTTSQTTTYVSSPSPDTTTSTVTTTARWGSRFRGHLASYRRH